jgi:hypothetical protein
LIARDIHWFGESPIDTARREVAVFIGYCCQYNICMFAIKTVTMPSIQTETCRSGGMEKSF